MSQTSTSKGQCIAKLLGIGLLIFSGAGCVATLKIAGASFGQWEIGAIRGLGAAIAIYLTAGVSGAHLNPAITIVLWLSACLDKRKVIPFTVSQVTGAFCAVVLVHGLYYNLFFNFEQTHHIIRDDVESIDPISAFSIYPNPHTNFVQVFTVEMVITVILMGLTLALANNGNGVPRGPLAPLLIGLLAAIIGTSMGPLTGLAVNPACDSDPKVFVWLAGQGSVAFTGGRNIPYFLVPLFGPIVGAVVGAFAYRKLIGRRLSHDICVVEEKETTTPSEQKVSL